MRAEATHGIHFESKHRREIGAVSGVHGFVQHLHRDLAIRHVLLKEVDIGEPTAAK
jgi:hypothetical protein